MNVRIHRIDPTLPLPEYHTSGAVAFDVMSRVDMEIAPKTLGYIPLNSIIETPAGYMLALASRSSLPKKKGLLIPHGFGLIDQDYCGPDDELLMQVYNFTDEVVRIARGERLGQGVFVKIDKAEFIEVSKDELGHSRGGFGSTGGHQ